MDALTSSMPAACGEAGPGLYFEWADPAPVWIGPSSIAGTGGTEEGM